RRRDRAGSTDRLAEIRPSKVCNDLLERAEEKYPVFLYRAPDSSTELLAMKVLERFAVGRVGGERLEPLKVKQASVDAVRSGFSDDVHHTAGSASELGAGAGRDNLELLDGFKSDVDRRALAAGLLAEEAIVVVAAVKADVVEDSALPREVYLIAVRSLCNAYSRCERQQVLEFSPQNRQGAHR